MEDSGVSLRKIDMGMFLDAGILLFAAGMVAGGVILLLGRTSGQVEHDRRHGEGPPRRGSIGSERHRNVQTVAAR